MFRVFIRLKPSFKIWTSLREIELAVERLAEWMQDESGVRDTPLMFKLNNPRVKKQPKGVGLIISPWNYPWFLVLGPMTGAIAAGCPFVIKVSRKYFSAIIVILIHNRLLAS
jgi:acyl-CoA reductase-like NAD-dependent aldehyde dehydrogenase